MKSLQLLRETAGFSRQALAERAGLSLTTVAHVEAGRKRLSRATAKKLAHALKVTIADVWDHLPKFVGYWIDSKGRKWPAQCMSVPSERSSWQTRNKGKAFPHNPPDFIQSPRLNRLRLDVTDNQNVPEVEGRIRAIRIRQRAPSGRAYEYWFLHPEDLKKHANPSSVGEDYAAHAIQTDDDGDEVRSPGVSWIYLKDRIKTLCEKRGVKPPEKHIGYSRFLLYRDTEGFPYWLDSQRQRRKPTIVERPGSAKYALKDDFRFCKTKELDKIAEAYVVLYETKGAIDGYELAEDAGMSAAHRCRLRKRKPKFPAPHVTIGVRDDGVVCHRHLIPAQAALAYGEARSVQREGLTTQQTAKVFGVSYPLVMKWIAEGRLFAEKKPESVDYDGPNGEPRSMLKGTYRVAVAEAARWWQQFKPGESLPDILREITGTGKNVPQRGEAVPSAAQRTSEASRVAGREPIPDPTLYWTGTKILSPEALEQIRGLIQEITNGGNPAYTYEDARRMIGVPSKGQITNLVKNGKLKTVREYGVLKITGRSLLSCIEERSRREGRRETDAEVEDKCRRAGLS